MQYTYRLIHKFPFISAHILAGVYYIFFFIYSTPVFETRDDFIMKYIISGNYTGTPENHAILINSILSSLLAQSYRIYPAIDWYSLFFYGIGYCSISAFVYMIIIHKSSVLKKCVIAGILIMYFSRFFLLFQFTTIAVMAGLAGLFLFITYLRLQTMNKAYAIYSIFLLIACLLIRQYAFFFVIFIGTPLLFFVGRESRSIKKVCIFLTTLTVVFLTAVFIHNNWIRSDPIWHNFMAFHDWRGYFHLYRLYRFDTNVTVYTKSGLSQNDYLMLTNWFYMDREIFTTPIMKSIIQSIQFHRFTLSVFVDSVKYLLTRIDTLGSYVVLSVICVFIYYPAKNLRFQKWLVVYAAAACAVGYYAYLGWLPDRFLMPILFYTHFAVFIFTEFTHSKKPIHFHIKTALYLSAFIMIGVHLFHYYYISKNNLTRSSQFKKTMSALSTRNKDILFLQGDALPYQDVRVFDSLHFMSKHHLILGNWTQRAPYDYAIMKRYGIDNIGKNLYTKNNLLLLTTPETLPITRQFILDHYGQSVCFSRIHTFSPYDAYLYKVHNYPRPLDCE